MRRKKGEALVANEQLLLRAALAMHAEGDTAFHGYVLSKAIGPSAMSYTTVYRCLDRLEARGLVTGEWELHDDDRRPRRVYRLTGAGLDLATSIEREAAQPLVLWRPA